MGLKRTANGVSMFPLWSKTTNHTTDRGPQRAVSDANVAMVSLVFFAFDGCAKAGLRCNCGESARRMGVW